MFNQWIRIKTKILGINRNHFQRFKSRRHAGHVTEFNGFKMIGMNAGHLASIIKA